MRSLRAIHRFAPVALAALLACGEPQYAPLEPSFARAPSGPTVTAASPDTAVQDTTLDVTVSGTGFDNGSSAEWLLAGVADPRVRTNSTRYVSTKSLVANITIASDAAPAKYDIAVTTSNGKKGIGTEQPGRYRVPTSLWTMLLRMMVAQGGDGRGPYVGNTCGWVARSISRTAVGTPFFSPSRGARHSPVCDGAPRVVSVDLGALGVQSVLGTNVRDVDHLVAGNSRLQDFGFGLVNSKACERVDFHVGIGGQIKVTATGSDALGRRTLVAESQAPHTMAGATGPSRASHVGWLAAVHPVPHDHHGGLLALGAKARCGLRHPGNPGRLRVLPSGPRGAPQAGQRSQS